MLSIHRALIAGGAAPEIELAVRLAEYAQSLSGVDQYCIRAFAEALEVIPYTLAENAGIKSNCNCNRIKKSSCSK